MNSNSIISSDDPILGDLTPSDAIGDGFLHRASPSSSWRHSLGLFGSADAGLGVVDEN